MQFLPIVLISLGLFQQAIGAPIVITRMHTAEAVTVTDTYTTVTNTFTAPTVEILVSNSVTYTFTLTDYPNPEPTTFTSFVNKDADVNAQPTADVKTTITLAPTTQVDNGSNAVPAQTTADAPANAPITAQAQVTQQATTQATTQTTQQDTIQITQQATTQTTQQATTQATQQATTQTTQQDTTQTTQQATTQTANTQTTNTQTTTYQAPTEIVASIATPLTTSTSTAVTTTSSVTAATGTLALPAAIVYSPYNDDGSCKDSSTVLADLTEIRNTGITSIRVYGTDCNSIQTVEPNAVTLGLKVNQGFWIGEEGVDSIDDGVTELIKWAQANSWSVFDFITVGNEAILAGYCTVDELIAKISSVRALLEAAGYTGKITTSEPPVTFQNNPNLCNNADIDFVGVNPHAYFDIYSSAATAGTFVKGQVAIVQEYCSKPIFVTETGYPSAGIVNGGNVPSLANQKIALQQILLEMDNQVTILSTFNDYWKQPGQYGIEQSFGSIQVWQQ